MTKQTYLMILMKCCNNNREEIISISKIFKCIVQWTLCYKARFDLSENTLSSAYIKDKFKVPKWKPQVIQDMVIDYSSLHFSTVVLYPT